MEYRTASKILLELQPKVDKVGIRPSESICQGLVKSWRLWPKAFVHLLISDLINAYPYVCMYQTLLEVFSSTSLNPYSSCGWRASLSPLNKWRHNRVSEKELCTNADLFHYCDASLSGCTNRSVFTLLGGITGNWDQTEDQTVSPPHPPTFGQELQHSSSSKRIM